MGWREPELFDVEVPGGALRVARWGLGGTAVLASHGITANHRTFAEVAAQFAELDADVSLYAVDHRGRGGSAALPGPYGLARHADDLIAVLDQLEVADAVLIGHSMGAFVAANAAVRSPDRISGLVLVDGGLPIELHLPPETDIEQVVRAVIGPSLDRLDTTFASPEEYLASWQAHPAFQGEAWNDVVAAYVAYDLVADGDRWRSPVVKAAVLEDGGGLLRDHAVRTAIERTTVPTTLLVAARGLLDQEPGLYPPGVADLVTAGLRHVTTRMIDDVNHYSVIFSPRGAREVADTILRTLAVRAQ